jgi:beta-galactosidase/beta-glucuronidase
VRALSSSVSPLGPGDRWYIDSTPRSHVEVVATSRGFEYLVNGVPQVIHGMGINTQYRRLLSPADRRDRLQSDMAEMQAMGVNTLAGWVPAEFDSQLQETAQRHGIGVVMPYDVKTDADYTDPSVRAALTQQALAWVQRYRTYPAVRMWGLGKELLHKSFTRRR